MCRPRFTAHGVCLLLWKQPTSGVPRRIVLIGPIGQIGPMRCGTRKSAVEGRCVPTRERVDILTRSVSEEGPATETSSACGPRWRRFDVALFFAPIGAMANSPGACSRFAVAAFARMRVGGGAWVYPRSGERGYVVGLLFRWLPAPWSARRRRATTQPSLGPDGATENSQGLAAGSV